VMVMEKLESLLPLGLGLEQVSKVLQLVSVVGVALALGVALMLVLGRRWFAMARVPVEIQKVWVAL